MFTQKELRSDLIYDEITGIFTHARNRSSNARLGKIAGTLSPDGYIRIRVLGKLLLAHRLAWFYHYDKWPEFELDHIDRNRSNNAIINLRDVNHTTNMGNQSDQGRGCSSLKGVYAKDGKWMAALNYRGERFYLGAFNTAELAYAEITSFKKEYNL